MLFKLKFFLSITIALGVLTLGSNPSFADEANTIDAVVDPSASVTSATNPGRFKIINENDYYASDDDRHYTQGARISYLSGRITRDGFWDQPYGLLSDNLPIFDGTDRKRKFNLMFGQMLYTPENTDRVSAVQNDRPYAAWLFTGVGLLQESKQPTHSTLENFEVQAGVVGRWALGGVTQNDFHQFINVSPSMGWENQLHNEAGVILTYERKWRFQQPLFGNLAVDVIPELGASAGNILTYGQGGAMVRFGQNMRADYGPSRLRPSASGADWFDADQLDGKLGWYVFAGAQGRAVARNIFLDGNTFRSSPNVDKEPFVADLMVGASVFWADAARLDFSIVQRTEEFIGQSSRPDRIGAFNLSFLFW